MLDGEVSVARRGEQDLAQREFECARTVHELVRERNTDRARDDAGRHDQASELERRQVPEAATLAAHRIITYCTGTHAQVTARNQGFALSSRSCSPGFWSPRDPVHDRHHAKQERHRQQRPRPAEPHARVARAAARTRAREEEPATRGYFSGRQEPRARLSCAAEASTHEREIAHRSLGALLLGAALLTQDSAAPLKLGTFAEADRTFLGLA